MESDYGLDTECGPECPEDPMVRIAVLEEKNRLLGEEARNARAERDRYRMVLEQPFAAMYCRNLKTDRYDYLSPSIEGILGFSAEEFSGMSLDTVLSRICPEDLPGVEAELNAVMRGGRNAGRTEYRFMVREGIVRWMADEFRVIRDETGEPLWRVGSVQDITGRKRAEECLRESEENLRRRIEEVEALMDVVPAAIWVSRDPKCDHITGNRMANVFYESREEENVSANCSPVRRFFREGRELRPEELPMQEAAREKINIRNTELEVLLESGVIRHMLGSASPLLDTRGKVRGCLGAFLDITDRKRTEETLRETNRMLEVILENTHSHIAYMTPDFTFIRVNRAYAEAGNHDQSFYPGKNHFDLYPNEENERHFRRVVETGEPFFIYDKPFEYTDQPGRGTTWWDWSLIPVRDESGRVTGVVLTLVDITERHLLMENIERLRREQEAFLRHEVKNLFIPIQLFSEILLREPGDLTPEQVHYIRRIGEAADRVNGFVDALKRVHDLEYGSKPLRKEPRALDDLIRRIMADLEPKASRSGVVLGLRAPRKSTVLSCDPQLMPGVFSNLILNAIEHVEALEDPAEKVVIIDLSIQRDRAVIRITNRGKPIPPERIGTFFEKYNVGPEKRHGTGLGTTYAWLVTRAHDGDITVASSVEEGTRVTVVLPLK